MPYATHQKFVEAVSEAEAIAMTREPPPAAAQMNVARIEQALANASSTLDSYFATKFPVPLSPVPPIVEAATITLAREELDRMSRDHVVKAADRVRAWARDVAKGVATLGSPAEGETEPLPQSTGGPDFAAPHPTFGPGSFAGYLPGCDC